MATADHTVVLTVEPDQPGTPPKVYRIVGMGPKVRAFFVQILKQRAWAELDRQALLVNPNRMNRLEAYLLRDMAAGKYEWGDDIHDSIDGTRAGFTALLLARLRAANPDAAESDVEALVNKFGWERLQAAMREADGPPLPNPPAPEAAGAESTTKN